MLKLLGADLGEGLAPASEHNQSGYWESQRFMHLHEHLLGSVGSFWYDWTSIDPERMRSASTAAVKAEFRQALHETFGDSQLFAIKDPRVCRFVPFWFELLADFDAKPACILPIRSPFEVAASLGKRDQLPQSTSYLLWLRHVLDAERRTRGMPRVITSFDGLLADWRAVVERLKKGLSISFPNDTAVAHTEIDGLLNEGQRHHRQAQQPSEVDETIVGWANEAYAVLREMELSGSSDDPEAFARLDAVSLALQESAALFGPVARAESFRNHQQERRWWDEAARMKGERDLLLAENKHLAGRLAQQKTSNGALQQRSDQLALQLSGIQSSTIGGMAASLIRLERSHQSAFNGAVRIPRSFWWLLTGTLNQRRQHFRDSKIITEAHLFDERAYVTGNVEAASSTMPPLLHWMTQGWQKGLDPHWLFSTQWYLAQLESPLSKASNPLLHYLSPGEGRVLDPSPFFNTDWYLQQHAEVAASGLVPLVHYLRYGAEQGWSPCPLFDSAWYLQQYADVAASGVDPLQHFIQIGHAEDRDPNPDFSTPGYRQANPELLESGVNPLLHYLTKQGR